MWDKLLTIMISALIGLPQVHKPHRTLFLCVICFEMKLLSSFLPINGRKVTNSIVQKERENELEEGKGKENFVISNGICSKRRTIILKSTSLFMIDHVYHTENENVN